MNRILIWRKPVRGGDIDIFNTTDYRQIVSQSRSASQWGSTNFGNKLWYQGICSVIDTPDNELIFGTDETPDQINENYDLIIYPMANFFSKQFCSNTSPLVKEFSSINIPTYVIACGAQADNYDQLDELAKAIGDQAKPFIEAIYSTGGEFALRGYFTKAFFDRLGFPSAVVTGCPSLFQMGPELRVDNDKQLDAASVKPVLNGKLNRFEKLMKQLPESVFFAQDEFIDCLYEADHLKKTGLRQDFSFFRNAGVFRAEMFAQDRIKMIIDMNEWYNFLKNYGFNYSFGSRIHGNIMPILAGIPATVLALDSRTRELAEFFDIPCETFRPDHKYTIDDLLNAYENADYTAFNTRFRERFDAYARFLTDHRIVKHINTNNRFFSQMEHFPSEEYRPNKSAFADYAKKLRTEAPLLSLLNTGAKIKKQIPKLLGKRAEDSNK